MTTIDAIQTAVEVMTDAQRKAMLVALLTGMLTIEEAKAWVIGPTPEDGQ
jgi:hypothetical protein